MRQHSGVSLCVGKVEAASKGVAELVVDGHAHAAQASSAQPGAVQGQRASGLGRWVLNNFGKGAGQGPGSFKGHQVDDGVGVAGVEGLD